MKKFILYILMISSIFARDSEYVKYENYPVLYTEEVYEMVRQRVPYEECWNERVTVGNRGDNGTGGAIIGGVAGGAIGSTIGEGSGKKAAIIGGAIIGSIAGHNMAHKPDTRHEEVVRKCTTRYEIKESRELVGYRNYFKIDGVEKYKFSTRKLNYVRVEISYNY